MKTETYTVEYQRCGGDWQVCHRTGQWRYSEARFEDQPSAQEFYDDFRAHYTDVLVRVVLRTTEVLWDSASVQV